MLGRLAVLVVLMTVGISSAPHAQSTMEERAQALDLIADTADRICNVVTTSGETQSSEVQGSIQAQLSRLASWLVSAGVSGSGKITTEQYQNVFREDLADVLRHNADCKVKVVELLHSSILSSTPGSFPQSGGGTSTQYYDTQQRFPVPTPIPDSAQRDERCCIYDLGWCAPWGSTPRGSDGYAELGSVCYCQDYPGFVGQDCS